MPNPEEVAVRSAARGLPVQPPSSREEIVAEIARLAGVVERIAGALDTATFFAPQQEDGTARWSPAEQVRHLTRSTSPLTRAFLLPRVVLLLRFGITLRASQSYAQLVRRYEHLLESKPQAGRFAPSRDDAHDDARRAEIMARFRDAISRLCAGVETWPEGALDRYRLPHPLLGKLSAREMLWFTVFHTAHHGGQIARRSARLQS